MATDTSFKAREFGQNVGSQSRDVLSQIMELIQSGKQTVEGKIKEATVPSMDILKGLVEGFKGQNTGAENPMVPGYQDQGSMSPVNQAVMDAGLKRLKKHAEGMMDQAVQSGGLEGAMDGLQQFQDSRTGGYANMMSSAQSKGVQDTRLRTPGDTGALQALTSLNGQSPTNQQAQPQGQDVLKNILEFLYKPSSVSPEGAYQPPTMFGGLMRESADESLAQQQRLNLQPDRQIGLKTREAEEVPLGRAKKEEIGLETQKELLKLRSTLDQKGLEGLPGEQATKFGLLLEGRDAVTEIDRLVGTGNIGGIATSQKFTPDFFKSPAQRQLQLAIETSIDSRTRVETGAAMAKSELEREAKKMMPKIGESKSTWRKRIGRSFDFFNRSISVADPTGVHEKRAMGARDKYAQSDLKQQALAELARRKGASNA